MKKQLAITQHTTAYTPTSQVHAEVAAQESATSAAPYLDHILQPPQHP